jgi:NADPH2:quinone reductase
MRAATFTHTGPAADVLTIRELPTPEPAAGEVRVKLATSGVNPSDVRRRGAPPAGKPAEFPLVIPHSDGAGTIDAVGPGVPASRIGERVWTINAQYKRAFGTAAEYCVLPSSYVPHLPDNTDFAVGACLGIPALTAYHAINLDGSMRGQTLLVQGGAGAVAFYAIQFAKLAGATVISTVSSDIKAERARSAGADHIVNYRTEDRKTRIAEITGGKGVDRIIEVDLKANVGTYQDLLVDHGKAVIYGSGQGPIPIPSFIPTSTTLQFILVYTLTDEQRTTYSATLNDLLTAGKLKHALGERFPLDRIAEAHERVEAGSLGNVIVEIPG